MRSAPVGLMFAVLLVACGGGPEGACESADDCAAGELCRDALCVSAPRDAGPPDAGARDAGVPSDAGARDAGRPPDAGVDASVPPPRRASVIVQTAGGGEASTSRMRMWGAVGAPQPFGRSSSGRYRLTVGPGAVP